MQAELGMGVLVVPDGLNGRTTAFDDHLADADRNGARILPTVLVTHAPIELVVILLGANDMKPFICGHAIGAKQGVERLVGIVRGIGLSARSSGSAGVDRGAADDLEDRRIKTSI